MKLAVADTIWGPHVVPCNDVNIGHALMLYGEFALNQAATLYRLLRPGDTALDVGANIGAMTLPMVKAVGPTGRVISFEPQEPLFKCLRATLALNELSPEAHPSCLCGVGRADGEMFLPAVDYDLEAANFGVLGLADAGATPIRIFALDSLLDTFDTVRLIKIDVEGMERDVLAGAHALIARDRPILFVENDRKDQSAALIADIEALGYDAYWCCFLLFNPDNHRGCQTNIYAEHMGSIDLLCLPSGTPLPDFLPNLRRAADGPPEGLTFKR